MAVAAAERHGGGLNAVGSAAGALHAPGPGRRPAGGLSVRFAGRPWQFAADRSHGRTPAPPKGGALREAGDFDGFFRRRARRARRRDGGPPPRAGDIAEAGGDGGCAGSTGPCGPRL